MVSEIKSLSEFESAVGSDKLVVVDFYATCLLYTSRCV